MRGLFRARARRGTVGRTTCERAVSESQTVRATPSGVTIHLTAQSRFHGFVFSPKPHQCADARKVKLMKQKGRHQNLKRDRVVARTKSFPSRRNNGKFKWSVAWPPRPGNYYARVAATPVCQADSSKTIQAS